VGRRGYAAIAIGRDHSSRKNLVATCSVYAHLDALLSESNFSIPTDRFGRESPEPVQFPVDGFKQKSRRICKRTSRLVKS
jgi:hypothetical protein